MSAVAVISIALVCTGLFYVERWWVGREARARARERWERAEAHDPDYGAYLRCSAVDPLSHGLACAVRAADVAAIYQRRFDLQYRGHETPFEFKRGRVQAAYREFEDALHGVVGAAERWLNEHPSEMPHAPSCRHAIEQVWLLGRPEAGTTAGGGPLVRVTTADRLAFMESAIAVMENARRDLYRRARAPSTHDPFRALVV